MHRDTLISIIIPTYKRPDGIAVALASVEHETVVGFDIEIIIADNDPKASAKTFIEKFAANSSTNIHYVHVPQPGVSNARNGALAVAKGRYIAFLDDDMEAIAPWLTPLITASRLYEAALVFGPATAVMPAANKPEYEYMQPEFSRLPHDTDGIIDEGVATGNCLIDLAKCELPTPPFDLRYNQTGGEDDALFQTLQAQGVKLAWAQNAKTWEHVPANRATLSYIWKRNLAFGQSPTQLAAESGMSGIFGITKWMLVGFAQTLIFGPIWLVLRLTGQAKHVQYFCKLAQGVGKVIWFGPFAPKLYGENATIETKP
ncbi:MAG: glycosyltransferase family 2 protein [Litorimonas sp.]